MWSTQPPCGLCMQLITWRRMDVKTTFLHSSIEEDLCMELDGLVIPGEENLECKLTSLYWLNQAPRHGTKYLMLLYHHI